MANPTPITNDIQLLVIVGGDMKAVMDDMSDKIVEIIKTSIENKVYNWPAGQYKRLGENGGFLGAWSKEVTELIGNTISNTIDMDANLLRYEPSLHQHGSLEEDRTEYMDTLIQEAPIGGYDFGGSAASPRDYWSDVVDYVESGLADWDLEAIFRKHGISFIRG